MAADVLNEDDQNDLAQNNDIELRELVYQSLERDGIIAHMKAQLRAAVFKAIEKASNPSDALHKPGYNGETGRICRALVFDWLEHSRLLYTKDILQVETSGPSHPAPLNHSDLLDCLHLDSIDDKSQPILHALLNQRTTRSDNINSLPDHIEQSIEAKFPTERINDIGRVRDHFRSLFSSAFDSNVLDAFFNKHIPTTTTTISKSNYEQVCLKWMQACAAVLNQPSVNVQKSASTFSAQPPLSKTDVSNGQKVTSARRSTSPPSVSSSSSSNSTSDNPRKASYDFPLPTVAAPKTNVVKKSTDINPPQLSNFNSNNDDDDESTSSIFSRRNATPAALNHLRNVEDIIRGGDVTPRTRTAVSKVSHDGNKDLAVEYDDESVSQSQLSSIDDVTVDKSSPSPSTHMDFFEDL